MSVWVFGRRGARISEAGRFGGGGGGGTISRKAWPLDLLAIASHIRVAVRSVVLSLFAAALVVDRLLNTVGVMVLQPAYHVNHLFTRVPSFEQSGPHLWWWWWWWLEGGLRKDDADNERRGRRCASGHDAGMVGGSKMLGRGVRWPSPLTTTTTTSTPTPPTPPDEHSSARPRNDLEKATRQDRRPAATDHCASSRPQRAPCS